MDRRLLDISQAGNINALHALLDDEPKILDDIETIPHHIRTPLHIAIIAGKSNFAKEIATMKPSFMTKFDRFGYAPIHLASERGQTEVIKYFLEINPNMLFMIKNDGKEKRTALHIAAVGGHVDVINLLVGLNPSCIMDLTARNETSFHLAVKNEQVVSFMVLLRWLEWVKHEQSLKRFGGFSKGNDFGRKIEDILNWKDDGGNTVLHLATLTAQHQMMTALLGCKKLESRKKGEPNPLNCNGSLMRALGIQLQTHREKEAAKSTEEICLRQPQAAGGVIGSNQIITLNMTPHLHPKLPAAYSKIDLLIHGTDRSKSSGNWRSSSSSIKRLIAMLLAITCFIAAGTKLPAQTNSYLLYAFIGVNVLGFILSLVILVAAACINRNGTFV